MLSPRQSAMKMAAVDPLDDELTLQCLTVVVLPLIETNISIRDAIVDRLWKEYQFDPHDVVHLTVTQRLSQR